MKEINQKGQALIFIALTFVVLGLFVGLAIDGGRAYLLKADLARKIDPAALAAAAKISAGLSAAQAAACNSAKMNGLDCTGLTVTQVTVNTPGGGSTTGIRISATATMSTGFFRLQTVHPRLPLGLLEQVYHRPGDALSLSKGEGGIFQHPYEEQWVDRSGKERRECVGGCDCACKQLRLCYCQGLFSAFPRVL